MLPSAVAFVAPSVVLVAHGVVLPSVVGVGVGVVLPSVVAFVEASLVAPPVDVFGLQVVPFFRFFLHPFPGFEVVSAVG